MAINRTKLLKVQGGLGVLSLLTLLAFAGVFRHRCLEGGTSPASGSRRLLGKIWLVRFVASVQLRSSGVHVDTAHALKTLGAKEMPNAILFNRRASVTKQNEDIQENQSNF